MGKTYHWEVYPVVREVIRSDDDNFGLGSVSDSQKQTKGYGMSIRGLILEDPRSTGRGW